MVVPRPSYIPCSNFQTAIGFIFNVTFWFAKVGDGTIITRKYLNFTKRMIKLFFSVNIKKKGSIHSFFFREMWKKRIDRNQVHFQFDILVCTGTWYYDGNDIFLCRITLMYICEEKKLLMYRKILFAIFEMIHSFMTMNLCNNFSVGAHSGLQKKSNTV